jgi:site-specific DNA-cytosine methylase
MTFLDLFAGIGGFRAGMELAGHKCVGFCEFDKFAVASYTSMHLITEEQRQYLSTLPLKQRQKEILKEKLSTWRMKKRSGRSLRRNGKITTAWWQRWSR